ncbi:pol-like protein [Apostichopus japonicus]|uniref:Pol-like protein n=1 Tax=Stichopus japonicus TaxID=307972 RepID=A0A2G8K8Z5_STIJA|nr:pol-like protein [Apostichopus japonicus]
MMEANLEKRAKDWWKTEKRRYEATRIHLGNQVERWTELKEKLGLKNDTEVARYLLHSLSFHYTNVGDYIIPHDTPGSFDRDSDGEDASRIDRVYAPVSFKFSGCETLSCPLSDHDTVVARFVLPSIYPIGRGLWKLNCRILGEAEFRQGFETRYKGWQTLKPAFASTSQWWDDVKLRIKRYAIQYCVTRARRRREKFSKPCAEVKFGDPSANIALQSTTVPASGPVSKRWKPRSALH